jgi:hypothetical protein
MMAHYHLSIMEKDKNNYALCLNLYCEETEILTNPCNTM